MLMKKFAFMLMMAFMTIAAYAVDATWTAAKQGYQNGANVETATLAEGVTATFAQAEGGSAPAYYSTGESVRLYAGNTLTISSTEPLTKISFVFTESKKDGPAFDASVGEIKIEGLAGVWTGNAKEIVLAVPSTTGMQTRIQQIVIGEGGEEVEERVIDDVLVELPAGVQTEEWALEGYFVYGDDDDDYEKVANSLQIGIKGQDVYIQGLSYYLPEAWVKGSVSADGKKITIPSPQYYGTLEYNGTNYPCYLLLNRYDYDQNIDEFPETVTFNFDQEEGVLEIPEDILFVENAKPIRDYDAWGYYTEFTIHKGAPVMPELVELPEGVEAAEYHFEACDTYYQENVDYPVQVAFDNTDVYFQGLSLSVPEAWVKGTLENGVVTLPENQYMGVYESFLGDSEIFFGGATFVYDAEKATFTSEEGFITTTKNYAFDEFSNVIITKVVEKVATPATPSILSMDYDDEYGFMVYPNVPLKDTEGNYLLSTKLSYQLYVDKNGVVEPYVLKTSDYEKLSENMTVIPYAFTDEWDIEANAYLVYVYGDVQNWSKIGVKSIYTGGGETRESAIGWYDVDYNMLTGVQTLTQNVKNVVYYDMLGRQTTASAKGLLIRQERMADGTVKNVKVVRK